MSGEDSPTTSDSSGSSSADFTFDDHYNTARASRSGFKPSASQPDFTRKEEEEEENRQSSNSRNRRESTQRRRSSSSGRNASFPQLGVHYTQKEVESVQRIQHLSRSNNYYQILNATKDSTDSELKKHYKELALQFHPDKNRAPGATEAFKVIGNAYEVLSDREKRQRYDLYGSVNQGAPSVARSRNNYQQPFHDYQGYTFPTRGFIFEGDVTAQDVCNVISFFCFLSVFIVVIIGVLIFAVGGIFVVALILACFAGGRR